MSIFLALTLAAVSVVAGMACLAAGMPHHRAMLGDAPRLDKRLAGWRYAGWGLLAAALYPCMAAWGGAIGFVLWVGLLTVGTLAVAGALAVFAHRARRGDKRRD
ncbi:MAG: hypothetical protein BGO63_13170 [Candidatus Accumulibacter sp. 66-26]|nr:DUF3325 domain-containing protein [Accumulibacter sp.]OJW52366.1 MAG: hypothetical protein BGO63_13170 [Candidatus Accumulibacter sp. 66-26]